MIICNYQEIKKAFKAALKFGGYDKIPLKPKSKITKNGKFTILNKRNGLLTGQEP